MKKEKTSGRINSKYNSNKLNNNLINNNNNGNNIILKKHVNKTKVNLKKDLNLLSNNHLNTLTNSKKSLSNNIQKNNNQKRHLSPGKNLINKNSINNNFSKEINNDFFKTTPSKSKPKIFNQKIINNFNKNNNIVSTNIHNNKNNINKNINYDKKEKNNQIIKTKSTNEFTPKNTLSNYSIEKKVENKNPKLKLQDVDILNNDIFLKKILNMFLTIQNSNNNIDTNINEKNFSESISEKLKDLTTKISTIIINNNINKNYINHNILTKLESNINNIQLQSKVRMETYKAYFSFIFEVLEDIKNLAKKKIEEKKSFVIENDNEKTNIDLIENNLDINSNFNYNNEILYCNNMNNNMNNISNSNFISSIGEEFYQKIINSSKSVQSSEKTIRISEDNVIEEIDSVIVNYSNSNNNNMHNIDENEEKININNYNFKNNINIKDINNKNEIKLNKSNSKKIFMIHPNQILEQIKKDSKISHRYSNSLKIHEIENLDNKKFETTNENKKQIDINKNIINNNLKYQNSQTNKNIKNKEKEEKSNCLIF